MAWLIRCLHILLKPSSREKGAIGLSVVAALTVGTFIYGVYSSGFLQQISGPFSRSMQNIGTGNTVNEDMNAFKDVMETGAKVVAPSAPWTTPWDLNAWIEYFSYSAVTDLVRKNVNTPTPKPGGRGRPGQPVACSLSVEPGLAAPGDYVSVTVTVPTIFKSRIAGISGLAGDDGFSIPPSGGSAVFSIPAGFCGQTLPISCEAYGPEGTVFSGSTSVKVDFSGLSDFDDDGIVDRCDPDDDNDGSLDGADCAPLDPNIFPGNEEICDDGIDQDCDGEDKPCETPGCNPPACCSEYPINCGDICCPADFPVCCGDGTCCPAGSICCGDTCCPAGTFCIDGNCIPDGSVYCGNGNSCPAGDHCCPGYCCPDGKACCGDGCCSPGWFCCPDQLGCCPVGTTCSEDGHCE